MQAPQRLGPGRGLENSGVEKWATKGAQRNCSPETTERMGGILIRGAEKEGISKGKVV